jgi:2-iminobutanoate/2-iminopropanoate deaminase
MIMQNIQEIRTDSAPAALGPYSQAVSVGDFIFCSGQIGLDPATGLLVSDDILAQTEQVMKNLQNVLESAGTDLHSVVKTEIFVTDISRFAEINEIYASYFTSHPQPARQTVEVSRLPKNANIEISVIALKR